jgi:hypothetical protein
MYKFLLFLLNVLIVNAISAQNEWVDPKLKEAFTQEQIAAMSSDQVEYLSVVANKLCYFQPVKDENAIPVDLKLKNGESVVLNQQQIENFNPLLYDLPQESVSCVNRVIKDINGNKHLLVIRSVKMIESDVKRMKSNKSNTSKK